MGQSYSADSPLLVRDIPLTTTEAETNANHIVDHLQTSRQKALLALYQCASEEYTKEHADLVESGEITADINNCDTILSSIAASRFALSDAIDEFPNTTRSDPSSNVFAELDNETQVINGTPIGILGFHSSIDLTPNAFISDAVGDQRVWFKALQTGQVYVGPATGGYWYNSDAIGRSYRNGGAPQLLRQFTAKSSDVEALLKLALRGKKNSLDFLAYRAEHEKRTNPYYYPSSAIRQEGETWEVFNEEPLAAHYVEHQLPTILQTTPSLSFGLAAYLVGICLCNNKNSNGEDSQRRYTQSSYYKLTNAVKYSYDTWTIVSESEILNKAAVFAEKTKCAFAIPPSRLLALLPNLSARFLEQSVEKCRNDVAKVVEEDLTTQNASRASAIRSGRVLNNAPVTSKFSQRSAADIIAATKRESQLGLGIYDNSPPGTFPGIELLTHHYTPDSFAQTSSRFAIQYQLNLAEYLRGIRSTSRTLHAIRFGNHWSGRYGHLRPYESESACLLGLFFAKKLFRRYFLSNGGNHLLPIDELHDHVLCENTMDDLMWLVQRDPAASSSLRNAAAAALLRATNPNPANPSLEDVKHLMILEEDNYSCVMSEDIACGNENGEFPVSVFEAWIDKNSNNQNEDQQEENSNHKQKEDEIDVDDGILRLQRSLPKYNEITNLTFFKEHHRINPGQPCFTSRSDFLRKWNKYTHGVLDGFYSPYAWVIGGAVVSSLDPTSTLETMGASTNRDIDICFAGLSHVGVLRHIQLFDSFMRNKFAVGNVTSAGSGVAVSTENWPFPHNMVTCSTSSTLTYVLPYPLPRVQVILGRWPSVGHLLRHTDVDCSGVALSLSQFYYLDDEDEGHSRNNRKGPPTANILLEPRVVLTPRSLHAWLYRISVPSREAHAIRGSIKYEMRLLKYALRDGFAVVHFDLGQTTLAKLKNLKLGEKIRITMTSGATWLYFADSGQFKPKMDAPSILDVSPTRGLSQVRDQIMEEGFAESDGYGSHEKGYVLVPGIASAMFRNKEAEEVGLLNKYAHLDTIWARNDVNRGGTIVETCTNGGQVGVTSPEASNYRYRSRNGENQLRSEHLWFVKIGHEHSVDTDSWTVDLDPTVGGDGNAHSPETESDPEDVAERGDDC